MSKKVCRFHYPPAKTLNYDTFWDSKIIQDFSFPNPLINYIILNPSHPNAYQKLLESCKYFYAKKKFLVIHDVTHVTSTNWSFRHLRSSKLSATQDFGKNGFDITKINENFHVQKLWLVKSLYLYRMNSIYITSMLYPKIYRCDIKRLVIYEHYLSLKVFTFLSHNVRECNFFHIVITDDENENTKIPFETILQQMPKLVKLNYHFTLNANNMSREKIKNFTEIPHLTQLEEIDLWNVPQLFDATAFVEYLRENNCWFYVRIFFSNNISVACKNQLSALIKSILSVKKLNFVPPSIYFDRYNSKNYRAILNLQDYMLKNKEMPPKKQSKAKRFYTFLSRNKKRIFGI